MQRFLAASAMICFLLAPAALATEFTIVQKDKKFMPRQLDIKVGDTLVFVNEEKKRRHNVYTKSPDYKYVKVRKQKPGNKDSVVITNAGTLEVLCALHPKMKLTVNVTE